MITNYIILGVTLFAIAPVGAMNTATMLEKRYRETLLYVRQYPAAEKSYAFYELLHNAMAANDIDDVEFLLSRFPDKYSPDLTRQLLYNHLLYKSHPTESTGLDFRVVATLQTHLEGKPVYLDSEAKKRHPTRCFFGQRLQRIVDNL